VVGMGGWVVKIMANYCDCGRRGKMRTMKLGHMIDAEPDGSRIVKQIKCDECAKAIGMFGSKFVEIIQ